MKFGTWCSKWWAVKKDFSRLWPAALIFCAFTLIKLGFNSMKGFVSHFPYPDFIALVYGAVCAMLVFRDLFYLSRAASIQAMPKSREELYTDCLLSGILLILLPLLPCLLFVGLRAGFPYALFWTGKVALMCLYAFSLGTFATMLSGSIFGAICNYLMVSLAPAFVVAWVQYYAALLIPGLNFEFFASEDIPYIFSDGGMLLSLNAPYAMLDLYTLPAFSATACALLLTASLFLHKKRKLENTGEFLIWPGLKIVAKGVLTLTFAVILLLIFPLTKLPYHFFPNALVWLLPDILVGFLLAEMIVERSVRVFRKKNFKRYGLCVLTVLVVSGLLWWDPAGLQSRAPKAKRVEFAEIHLATDEFFDHYNFTAHSPEGINAILELHQDIGEDSGFCIINPDERSDVDILIRYTLRSGRTVTRAYTLDVPRDDRSPDPAVAPWFYDYIRDPQWMLSLLLGTECTLKEAGGTVTPVLQNGCTMRVFLKGNSPVLDDGPVCPVSDLLIPLCKDIRSGAISLYAPQTNKDADTCFELVFWPKKPEGSEGSVFSEHLYIIDPNCETAQYLQELMKDAEPPVTFLP